MTRIRPSVERFEAPASPSLEPPHARTSTSSAPRGLDVASELDAPVHRGLVHGLERGLAAAGGALHALAASLVRRHPVAVAAVILGTLPLAPPLADASPLRVAEPPHITVSAKAEKVAPFRVVVDRHAKGAYFRKISSGTSTANVGVRATGVLPSPTFDPDRRYLSPAGADDYRTGPLDRPSLYLGGRAAGHELDAGLTWDRVYDADGRATYTDRTAGMSDGRDLDHRFVLSGTGAARVLLDGHGKKVAEGTAVADRLKSLAPNFAFRPYFRTSNGDGDDWHQPKPGSADNVYFYPGERFAMSVRLTGKSALEMVIRTEDGASTYTTQIHNQGFGGAKGQSFKGIISIDQFMVNARGERTGLEGRDVLPTQTRSTGGRFDALGVLVRSKRGEPKLVPMRGRSFTEVHGADTHARYGEIFHVRGQNAAGGEAVDILPPTK